MPRVSSIHSRPTGHVSNMLNMRELHGLQLNLAKTVPFLLQITRSVYVNPTAHPSTQHLAPTVQTPCSVDRLAQFRRPRFPIIMTLLSISVIATTGQTNHASFIETGKRIHSLMDTPITS